MRAELDDLKFECFAIGSMPHDNLETAMKIVKKYFSTILFWPQMVKLSKNEDIVFQFLEGMPSFFSEKSYLDTDYKNFKQDVEIFFNDYELILSGKDIPETVIDKYSISSEFALAFSTFIDILRKEQPKYAKGQVVGPYTLSMALKTVEGRPAFYDELLRNIICKICVLKSIWQIKKMKQAAPLVTPVIFVDEPSISKVPLYSSEIISNMEVRNRLKELSSAIKLFGGISVFHCCSQCDWSIPIQSGFDMINLDAYNFSNDLIRFSNEITNFLNNGGKIVWGLVPTLNTQTLQKCDTKVLLDKFETVISNLTDKGIDKKLIINNSLISAACGTGNLSVELAEKAFNLTKELSDVLKNKYQRCYDI